MAYIGRTPTPAALTASDIADGIVSEAKMADDAISLTELKAGTDGNIISYDASGNPVAVATGTDGQVLTSAGAGQPPAFEAGGLTGVTTGSGNVTITNGNLILGTSGKGIDFSATGDASTTGSSMTAEVLDDYEEGTFTLATSGITYVRNTGYYRKIGALVYIQCYLTVDTYTSGTRVSIEGLPFASKNIAAYDGHHPISIARWDNLHISTIAIYPKVGSGGTSIGCDSIASSADGVTGNVEIFGDDATMRFGGCYPVD